MGGEHNEGKKAEKKMSVQDKFNDLATEIKSLLGKPYDKAWNDAQVWKDESKQLISNTFADMPEIKNDLLNRVKRLFTSQPSYVVNGVYSQPLPESELQRIFETDITEAIKIMQDCIEKCNAVQKSFS